MTELNIENLKTYQVKVNNLDNLKEELKKKKAEFEINNQNLLQEIDVLGEELRIKKDEFKELAVLEYNKTKEKKLIGGLGIRVGTNLIYEEKEAYKWAVEHSLCLKLDSKAFEKIAKSEEMEFVKKEEKITATFPKEIKFENNEG